MLIQNVIELACCEHLDTFILAYCWDSLIASYEIFHPSTYGKIDDRVIIWVSHYARNYPLRHDRRRHGIKPRKVGLALLIRDSVSKVRLVERAPQFFKYLRRGCQFDLPANYRINNEGNRVFCSNDT